MTRFRQHMSKVVAAATVNGMEAITEIIRASERDGSACLESLHTAKEDLLDLLTDLDAAIATEIAARPTATPTIKRIRMAVQP